MPPLAATLSNDLAARRHTRPRPPRGALLRYGASIAARRQRQSAPARAEIRTRVPDAEVAGVRDVRFSTAIRGYDRDEVDRYITHVNQVVAELQITAAPESAVKHALEQVAREQKSVIDEAHRTAEEITRRSRSKADDRVQEAAEEAQKLRDEAATDARDARQAAEREAQQIRAAAEARVRELEAQVEGMIEKRTGVIEELRDLAGSLDDFVDANGRDRAPAPEPVEADVTD